MTTKNDMKSALLVLLASVMTLPSERQGEMAPKTVLLIYRLFFWWRTAGCFIDQLFGLSDTEL